MLLFFVDFLLYEYSYEDIGYVLRNSECWAFSEEILVLFLKNMRI